MGHLLVDAALFLLFMPLGLCEGCARWGKTGKKDRFLFDYKELRQGDDQAVKENTTLSVAMVVTVLSRC